MNFTRHSDLIGKHAIMSASKYHWINYDLDKFRTAYYNQLAVQQGTELHDLASKLIHHRVPLPRQKKTLNLYVNDAIHYRMTPEQPLFYSRNWFGTADAISFNNGLLRIHDLKTGAHDADIRQLMIYTALFCLEYDEKPEKIDIELRIYQNNQALVHSPDPNEIHRIMDLGIMFDKEIENMRQEDESL